MDLLNGHRRLRDLIPTTNVPRRVARAAGMTRKQYAIHHRKTYAEKVGLSYPHDGRRR